MFHDIHIVLARKVCVLPNTSDMNIVKHRSYRACSESAVRDGQWSRNGFISTSVSSRNCGVFLRELGRRTVDENKALYRYYRYKTKKTCSTTEPSWPQRESRSILRPFSTFQPDPYYPLPPPSSLSFPPPQPSPPFPRPTLQSANTSSSGVRKKAKSPGRKMETKSVKRPIKNRRETSLACIHVDAARARMNGTQGRSRAPSRRHVRARHQADRRLWRRIDQGDEPRSPAGRQRQRGGDSLGRPQRSRDQGGRLKRRRL
jgi:hypothetical protein